MRIVNSAERAFTFNEAGHAAMRAFRDAKPWRGTLEERAGKFAELHRSLCRAYDLETIMVRDVEGDPTGTSAGSLFDRRRNRIVLSGRLSVVTYLVLFAVAAGASQRSAALFARGAFASYFPRSFARCETRGGLLYKV